jgi:hypothetical protein
MLLGKQKVGKMNTFLVTCVDNTIHNESELIKFLSNNQSNDITLTLNPEAPCLRSIGLYTILDQFNFTSVTIHTQNILEFHDIYNICVFNAFTFFKRCSNITVSSKYQVWNTSDIFHTLYGHPRAERIGISSYLISNHKDISSINCSFKINNENSRLNDFELSKLFSYDSNSIKMFSNLIDNIPTRLEGSNYNRVDSSIYLNFNDPHVINYRNILIDIVAETFTEGNTFFVTEKTIRPILMKKPFIIIGSQDYLDYLHMMGFKTFNDYWNEDYDGYEGKDRYLKVLKLIDDISSYSIKELRSMYNNMTDILNHNYDLLTMRLYSTDITKIA